MLEAREVRYPLLDVFKLGSANGSLLLEQNEGDRPLAIARANHPLQEMLKRAGLTERIGLEHLYPTVRTGVQAFLEQPTG